MTSFDWVGFFKIIRKRQIILPLSKTKISIHRYIRQGKLAFIGFETIN